MAQSSTTTGGVTLYPQLEPTIDSLDKSDIYLELIRAEKAFTQNLRTLSTGGDLLLDLADVAILPTELISDAKKSSRAKIDPLKRLKELTTDEVEEEEEPEDEESEDEEQAEVEDEEDGGGDYLVSHFDNGEGYEDNDDECEDMTSVI